MSEPPTNLEAEESVLGAMMVNKPAMQAVLSATGLRPDHFYRDRHRLVFRAIARLAAIDEPVEPLTVAGELERQAKLTEAGGRDGVSHLASIVPIPGNATHYAGLVIEAAQLRSYMTGAHRILEGVAKRDREAIQRGLEQASADLTHENEPVEPTELADEFADWIYSDAPAKVWTTGFGRLDNLAGGGLYPGQVTALIGWPSDGKTTWLDGVMNDARTAGGRGLILATEMPRRDRIARFVSARTGIPWKHLMLRTLNAEQKQKVLSVLDEIPFAYREIKGWSVDQVCTEIAIRKPDIAAIDSLHGLPYRDAAGLRQISTRLAATANRIGCHLILVCQLNTARATAKEYPEPVERDIRDSGSIAYDADNTLSIYRHRDKDGQREETGFLRWLKARNGIAGPKVGVRLIPGSYGFEGYHKRSKSKAEPEPEKPEPATQSAMTRPVDH